MIDTLVMGNTYTVNATLTKDGSTWDLSSATVDLLFRRPNGTTFSRSATISTPASGEVTYTITTTDLDVEGRWTRRWEVTDGGTVAEQNPESEIRFVVSKGFN